MSVFMYVRMYICIFACMCVCMYVIIYIFMSLCVYSFTFKCMYVYMKVRNLFTTKSSIRIHKTLSFHSIRRGSCSCPFPKKITSTKRCLLLIAKPFIREYWRKISYCCQKCDRKIGDIRTKKFRFTTYEKYN